MKTFFNYILGKVLSWLSNSTFDELMTTVNLVKEASTKFKESKDKRDWVLQELKKLWSSKEESTLRYLLETAVKYIKK